MTEHSREIFEELRCFDTPTISNAIEMFDIRPRTEGFMSSEIKSIINHKKPYIGYACTAKISAIVPSNERYENLKQQYYQHVKDTLAPSISVIEDLDNEPTGSFWGEVHASIHKSLGCEATVTNGGVRDLSEVKEINFGYFAKCVLVSHANVHVENYNCTVNVGGIKINPGDILHADQHGVIVIPESILGDLAEACRLVQKYEKPIIVNCQKLIKDNKEAKIKDILEWRREMKRLKIKFKSKFDRTS